MNQKDNILKLVFENIGKIQTKLVVEQNGQVMLDNKREYRKYLIVGIESVNEIFRLIKL